MDTFSKEILNNICDRVRAYRIEYPLTQKELSEKSGVSVRSIQMFENGHDIQLSNLIKILGALDLEKNFNVLVPDVTRRPSMYVEHSKPKQRVRKKNIEQKTEDFKWGEDK